jgi:hypothetical protein
LAENDIRHFQAAKPVCVGMPERVLRGGSWNNNNNNARSANRNNNTPDNINNNIGFRCARSLLTLFFQPECIVFTNAMRALWKRVLAIPA